MVLRRAARFLWLGCENGHGIRKKYLGKARSDSGWMIYFCVFRNCGQTQTQIVIAENVMGIIKGNAKGYVNEIIAEFHKIGYRVQLFQLDAAFMDVPSKRERVFLSRQIRIINRLY